MSEHTLQSLMLVLVALQVCFVGYLAYKAYRSSKQIEGLTAATYLEARKALDRSRSTATSQL